MAADFQNEELGEVAELFDSLHQTPQYSGEGYPMIRVTDIRRGYVDTSNAIKVDEATYLEFSKKHRPKVGDILFSRVGSYGNSAYVNRYEEFCLGQNTVCISSERSRIEPTFLYFALNSGALRDQIESLVGGASQGTISLKSIRKLQIPLPPLPIQRRIAGILSAYDELIENSQRRIKILESMARGLYREWFVHFRFPGHEHHPRVPSPLGEIPEGWEVKKLGTLADISWGDTSTTKAAYVEEGYAAYSASGLDGKLDHYDFDRVGIVLSAIGAQCGKTWLARGKWSCIKNTIRFWSKNECVSTEFLFIATLGQDFWPRRGAAQPFISQGDAERIDVLIPDRVTMNRFTIFAAVSLKHIATLNSQIQNFRRTRDLLLPRLLSGQIDVEAIAS
ncbi:MAG: restriction endonuclease subunit S [Cyanobacteriota bacterium]